MGRSDLSSLKSQVFTTAAKKSINFDHGVLSTCNSMPASDNIAELSLVEVLFANG